MILESEVKEKRILYADLMKIYRFMQNNKQELGEYEVKDNLFKDEHHYEEFNIEVIKDLIHALSKI